MKKIFDLILNFYSALFFIVVLVFFLYFHLVKKEDITKAYLHAYLFWNIGVRGIIAYVANTYPPSARTIRLAYNWKDDVMQRELAANNGAIGVLGILCLWFDGMFWIATLIGGTLVCIFSEIGNLANIFKGKNFSFSKHATTSSYLISTALLVGMHLDLAVSIFSLILGLYQTSSIIK